MTALKTALNSIRAERPGKILPKSIVADVLNKTLIKDKRSQSYDEVLFHVSDLMKMRGNEIFCPREHVLHKLENRGRLDKTITPGMNMLFAMGHAIHDHVRELFSRNTIYGQYIWGLWECDCGKTSQMGYKPKDAANICKMCRCLPTNYVEYTTYNRQYHIVGHPDLIIKLGKIYYLYEIKSLSRKDITWNTLNAPLGDHTLQGTFYHWLLKEEGFNMDKDIRYLYADRSGGTLFYGTPYKEFVKRADGIERLKPFLDKAESVLGSIAQYTLPDRICDDIGCSRSKNCDVKISCFNRDTKHVSRR